MRRDVNSEKWILKRIRPYALRLAVLVAVMIVMSYVNVQFAFVSKSLIDTATNQAEGSVVASAVRLGVLLLVQLVLQVLYIRIHITTSGKLAMSIRSDIFYQLMKKDFAGVSSFHSGEVLNRLISDVSLVAERITQIIPNVASLLSTIGFSFAALFTLDKQFALICLAFGPVVLLAAYIYRKKIKSLHLQCRESDGVVRSYLQETVQNFLVVKAFRREAVVRRKSELFQFENYKLNVKLATVGILANILFFLAATVGYYAALAWSVYRLSMGLITFGTMTAVLGLVGQFQSPFRGLASVLPQYYTVLASAERLIELENIKDEVCRDPLQEEEIGGFQALCVDNVDFSYDSVSVLKGVSFTVKKGEFVALCGNSGAGKSTLTKLLLAVLKPDAGQVYLTLNNGKRRTVDAGTRRLFSYVPQGNLVFSGTVRENIAFADESPDEGKIVWAADVAQLSDVISSLPHGLDTVLGEKGHGLSEGQVQRIAVARALYYDAPVLLLDEATSALDIATEEKLLSNIKQMTDKTCIIISHRKEVMEACDKTYLLSNGALCVL